MHCCLCPPGLPWAYSTQKGGSSLNYLAHALLAEPHAHSIIGNLAGDLVKGPIAGRGIHPRIVDGIRRHRRVDGITDRHPRFRELRLLLGAAHRRVAGIVLDVLFDHYLTRHWSRFSHWDRESFIGGVYEVLMQPPAPPPAALAAVAPRWVAADWLRVYESRRGVEAVLERLEKRSRRPVALLAALEGAQHHDEALEAGFLEIFRDVQARLDGLYEPVPSLLFDDTHGASS